MAIIATTSKVHWNYFLALEHDLELASRYVEFCDANMRTFSIEFVHLLLAAASEVDVVAKLLCQRLSPAAARGNIEQYRAVLIQHLPDLATMQVFVPRYGLTLTPWDNWANGNSPDWWGSYNNVKHERGAHFDEATLKHALNALAGLHCLVFHHYDFESKDANPGANNKDTSLALQPESSLLRFGDGYYYDNIIAG
ncbi:MAG: hypothetical protein ABI351_06795 [Herbaspirillum sp.]